MNKILSVLTLCLLLLAVFASGCISDTEGGETGDDDSGTGGTNGDSGDVPSDDGSGDSGDDTSDDGSGDGGTDDGDDGGDDGTPDDGDDDGDDGSPDDGDDGSDDGDDDGTPDDGDDGSDDGTGNETDGGDDGTPDDGDDGSDEVSGNLVNVSMPQRSGWLESESPEHQEPVAIPESTVVEITFRIHVEDSDEEHAETDEGSDPDIIKASATDNAEQSQQDTATTPGDMTFTFKAPEATYLAQNWTVKIWGQEFGGGKPAYFFGFIVWVDQGVAWTLDVEYVYQVP